MNRERRVNARRRSITLKVEVDGERVRVCEQAARREADDFGLVDGVGCRLQLNAIDVFAIQAYVECSMRPLRHAAVLVLEKEGHRLPGAQEQIRRETKI